MAVAPPARLTPAGTAPYSALTGLPEPRPPTLPAAASRAVPRLLRSHAPPRPHGRTGGQVSALWVTVRLVQIAAPTAHRGPGVRTSRTPLRRARLHHRPRRFVASQRTPLGRTFCRTSARGHRLSVPRGPSRPDRTWRIGKPAVRSAAPPQRQIRLPRPAGADPPHLTLPPSPRSALFWPCDRPTGDEQATPPTGLSLLKNKEGLKAHWLFLLIDLRSISVCSLILGSKQAD